VTRGVVTGTDYSPGDYIYPADVKVVGEGKDRRANFKTEDDLDDRDRAARERWKEKLR
jgi:hypothetical protein